MDEILASLLVVSVDFIPADILDLVVVEAVEEGHNHHILVAEMGLLVGGNPEVGILGVCCTSAHSISKKTLMHTGILVVVGHN